MNYMNVKSIAIAAAAILVTASTTLAQGQGPGIPASDVNVVNVPTVTIGNTASEPVPVKEATKQPVYRNFQLPLAQFDFVSEAGVFVVPANTRFVLQHVSLRCSSASPAEFTGTLTVGTTSGTPTLAYVPATSFASPGLGTTTSVGAMPITALVDEGTVRFRVSRGDASGSANCFANLVGYLTPLQ